MDRATESIMTWCVVALSPQGKPLSTLHLRVKRAHRGERRGGEADKAGTQEQGKASKQDSNARCSSLTGGGGLGSALPPSAQYPLC